MGGGSKKEPFGVFSILSRKSVSGYSPPVTVALPLPPPDRMAVGPPSPLPLLRCGDVHPHLGPLRVAQANVTSLRMHWHTVAEWQVDVVLLSETHLTAVAQQMMRA